MDFRFLDAHADPGPTPDLDGAFEDLPPLLHLVEHRGPDATGIALPTALGGIVLHPARTVLALPGWEDAFEAVVDEQLVVCFDAEKLLRMLLHASQLAIDILASPVRHQGLDEAHDLLRWALNRRHLSPARDAQSALLALQPGELSLVNIAELMRRFLQGHLVADGAVTTRLGTMIEVLELDIPARLQEPLLRAAKLEDVAEPLEEGILGEFKKFVRHNPIDSERSRLPENPADYGALSDWLVSRRLESA